MLAKTAHLYTRHTYVVLKTKYIFDVDEKNHTFLMLKIKDTYVVLNTERHVVLKMTHFGVGKRFDVGRPDAL